MGEKLAAAGAKLPRIYTTNWFRKGADGKFVWPGYGENMRVLTWMIDRIEGRSPGQRTCVRHQPGLRRAELDRPGLHARAVRDRHQHRQGRLDRRSCKLHAELFERLAYHLPPELQETRKRIETRLAA